MPVLRAARVDAVGAAINAPWYPSMSSVSDAIPVVFLPSGRRGTFAHVTPLLTAARQLGVYIDSVCGGRGLCGRCQILCAEGDFPKHGLPRKRRIYRLSQQQKSISNAAKAHLGVDGSAVTR